MPRERGLPGRWLTLTKANARSLSSGGEGILITSNSQGRCRAGTLLSDMVPYGWHPPYLTQTVLMLTNSRIPNSDSSRPYFLRAVLGIVADQLFRRGVDGLHRRVSDGLRGSKGSQTGLQIACHFPQHRRRPFPGTMCWGGAKNCRKKRSRKNVCTASRDRESAADQL